LWWLEVIQRGPWKAGTQRGSLALRLALVFDEGTVQEG
jgi:hypothetical protein